MSVCITSCDRLVSYPIQMFSFLTLVLSSRDWLQIHHKPDLDKTASENEWNLYSTLHNVNINTMHVHIDVII